MLIYIYIGQLKPPIRENHIQESCQTESLRLYCLTRHSSWQQLWKAYGAIMEPWLYFLHWTLAFRIKYRRIWRNHSNGWTSASFSAFWARWRKGLAYPEKWACL